MYSEKNEKASKITGILIIVFIGLVMIFSNINTKELIANTIGHKEKPWKEIESYKTNELVEGTIGLYEGGIVHFTKNQLIGYNFEGVSLWNLSIPSEDNKVCFGEEGIYILEKETGKITAVDYDGNESWVYEARQEADNLVEKGRYIFLLLKSNNNQGQISILDRQGNMVFKKTIEGGNIITATMSADESRFAMAILDLSERELGNRVTVYSKGGKVIWDEVLYEELVLDMGFVDEGTIVVSDKKIYLFGDEKEILWSRELKGNILDLVLEKNISVLLQDREGCYLETIGPNGETITMERVPQEYRKIKVNNNDYYLISKQSILGVGDGKQVLEYRSKKEIESVRFLNDIILISTIDEIKKMKLVDSNE